MEQDKLKVSPLTPLLGGEGNGTLVAEEGASLSSGSLRLYYLLPSSTRKGAGGEAAGCVDLYAYDPLNRRAAVGIMVATEYRRQGHALAMLHALQQLATANWHLHSLYADIAESNAASIALFAKAGYRQCGLFHQWLNVNDQYIDSIRMQKIL